MSNQTATALSHVEPPKADYEHVIDDICNLNWAKLNEEDLIRVAWAYYHFSVQFRECLVSHAKCTLRMSGCCSLIMANATPTIFRPGRELLSLERK